MDEKVVIPATALQELLARLTDRRLNVEKELSAFGNSTKGHHDIFKHCRQFERVFQTMLNEANVAFKIRAVVEGNLPETLRRIPIEKRFNKNYTREICREADGYQPHLVSPERGIKRLVQEAMKLTSDHVHRFVDEIHMVLMETVKEAARNIMTLEVGGGKLHSSKAMDYMRLKGFENAVIMAASEALEEWRAEAHKVAAAMVQMECDYVTPSFFRDLERQWQEEAAAAAHVMGDEDGSQMHGSHSLQSPSTGVEDEDSDGDSNHEANMSPRESGPYASKEQMEHIENSRADVKAGWLEKRAGDSSNLSSLPVDSWRWQKRWFVLAMESGLLFYYPSPEDVNKKSPKVAVNLKDCIVEDFQPEDANISTKKSTQKLDNNAGSVSLLIRIFNKNPHQKVAKQHHAVILRAADASDKYDWLARLRRATEPGSGVAKGPKISAKSEAYLQAPSSSRGLMSARSEQQEQRGLFGRTVDKVSHQFSKMTGLGSSKMGDVLAVGSIEDLDAYYDKLGTFCGLYARMTYDRMAKSIPKAIILCQVINSRDRLLDQLFHYLSSRTEKEIEFMLQEDPSVARRRAAASQASKDLGDSLEEVRRTVDFRSNQDSRGEMDKISVRSLLLAGAFPLVPRDLVPASTNPAMLYGEFTPGVLVSGEEVKNQLGKPTEKTGSETAHRPSSPQENGESNAQEKAPVKPRRLPPPPPK